MFQLDGILDFVLWTYQLFILFSLYFEILDVVIISKWEGVRDCTAGGALSRQLIA